MKRRTFGYGLLAMVLSISLSLFALQGICYAGAVLEPARPATPVSWPDEIVVMDTATNYAYSGDYTQTQRYYINFAWKNTGDTSAGAHTARLYIDGNEVVFSQVSPGGLVAGAWMKLSTSFAYTFETSGQHTISFTLETTDPNTTISDSPNYTRTITVQSDGKAHLRPYQPATWSDKIVVSTATGATSDSAPPAYINEISYLNFAWMNIGDVAAAAGAYTANVYVYYGGDLVDTLDASDYLTNPGAVREVTDWAYIFTSSGDYTLKLGVQANGDTQEYTYSRTVSVTGNVVNLKPYTPTAWSSPIVVSYTKTTAGGTPIEYTPTAKQIAYISTSWVNTSEADSGPYTVVLYADGNPIYTYTDTTATGLEGGHFIKDIDTEYTFATAGSHSLSLVVDEGNAVTESNETDNVYERTVQVAAPTFNLDIDGSGTASDPTPLGDGLMIVRYLVGFRGSTLIDGALDTVNCTRCTATEIETYIQSLMP